MYKKIEEIKKRDIREGLLGLKKYNSFNAKCVSCNRIYWYLKNINYDHLKIFPYTKIGVIDGYSFDVISDDKKTKVRCSVDLTNENKCYQLCTMTIKYKVENIPVVIIVPRIKGRRTSDYIHRTLSKEIVKIMNYKIVINDIIEKRNIYYKSKNKKLVNKIYNSYGKILLLPPEIINKIYSILIF